ncbi:hypothetical protein SHAL103562_18490 [Shewanella algae]|nr:hypothetical protein TUM3811_18010 [Shewanella algae]
MEDKTLDWLDSARKTHTRLTESVITVFENLLKANNIDFLAGRPHECLHFHHMTKTST